MAVEIYGTETASFVDERMGVRATVQNGAQPKHVTGACYMKAGRPIRIGNGNVLMVEKDSELILGIGYFDRNNNLGFGVKVNTKATTFVAEQYYPTSPRPGWVYGSVDRDDQGSTLRVRSGREIEDDFGKGSGMETWVLTVEVWPIEDWEGPGRNPQVVTSATRSASAGGVVSGRPLQGGLTNARHTRILRSNRAVRKDIAIYVMIGDRSSLETPVLPPPSA